MQIKFEASNGKKYRVKAICNNAIYAKKLENQLLKFYSTKKNI